MRSAGLLSIRTRYSLRAPLLVQYILGASSLSALAARRDHPVSLIIDLFPNEDDGALAARLLAHLQTNQNKTLRNTLRTFVPPLIASALATKFDISETVRAQECPRTLRVNIVQTLKRMTLSVTGVLGAEK